MDFQPLTLAHRSLVEKYMRRHGEGSCQHSFASMFCFNNKYGHSLCEINNRLFIRRDKLSDGQYSAYFMPMGNGEPAGLLQAVEFLKNDARKSFRRVKLETVTENAKNILERCCPGMFEAEERRDYSEYIYTSEKLAELPGSEMASKRHDVNNFWRNYSGRVLIKDITADTLGDIQVFQENWLKKHLNNTNDEHDAQLELENEAIMTALEHFEALNLSGILLYADGVLHGYAYGSKISNNCYDVMIEKGDREIEDIYRILNMEIAKRCCHDLRYINREEDLGVAGLRKAKLSYKPDILLKKYILKEVGSD